jgi:hypothetical protein
MAEILRKNYALKCTVVANKDWKRRVINYTARLFAFEASGKTPNEAVAALSSMVERAAAADGAIFIARWRDYTLITHYKAGDGLWVSHRISTPTEPECFCIEWLLGGRAIGTQLQKTPGRPLVESLAKYELVDFAWLPTDGLTIPCALPGADIQNMASLLEFRLRYADAKSRNLSEQASHDYAGRNPTTPELWSHEPREKVELVQVMRDEA